MRHMKLLFLILFVCGYAYAGTYIGGIVTNVGQPNYLTTSLNMNGHSVTNMANPVLPNDAATRVYVDDATNATVQVTGDTMSGDLDMGGNKLTNVEEIIFANEFVTIKGGNFGTSNALILVFADAPTTNFYITHPY